MAVRDPNAVPLLGWWLATIASALFVVAWVLMQHRDRPWKRHAKSVEPAVLDRKMLERLRQSGIDRMPRS